MPTLQDVIWEKDLTPYLHVKLLDVDITDDVLSEQNNGISGIENILDYPELNVFKSSNIILTLANDDGRFSPDNPTNFFIQNGDPNAVNSLKADGFGAKVSVSQNPRKLYQYSMDLHYHMQHYLPLLFV